MRVVIVLATLATLAACNTVSGVGQDVKAGGAAISNSAETVRRKLQ